MYQKSFQRCFSTPSPPHLKLNMIEMIHDINSGILKVNTKTVGGKNTELPKHNRVPAPGRRCGFQRGPQGPDSRWTPLVWVWKHTIYNNCDEEFYNLYCYGLILGSVSYHLTCNLMRLAASILNTLSINNKVSTKDGSLLLIQDRRYLILNIARNVQLLLRVLRC